jgi:hypothetical protein
LDIKEDAVVFDNRLQSLSLKPASNSVTRLKKKMRRADTDESIAFVCVQSLEMGSNEARECVLCWLDERAGTQIR